MTKKTYTASPTLDQLADLYRQNGFEVVDSITWPDCTGEPMLNIIRFEGDDDEGKRAFIVAKQNGYGCWLSDLQRTWDLEGGEMHDDPYWRLTFYANSSD